MKKDSRGLCRGAAGNPRVPRLLPGPLWGCRGHLEKVWATENCGGPPLESSSPCLGSLSAGHRVPIRCPCPRAGPGLPALGNQGSNLLLSLVCGPPRPPDRTKAGLGATEPGVGPGRQVPECGGISLCCQGTGVGCPSSWLVGSHRPKLENTAQRECSGSSCPAKAGGPRPAGVGEHWACSRPGFDSWVRKFAWRRERLPTPVFLLGEVHGRRSLVGYSPWGCKESDTTE